MGLGLGRHWDQMGLLRPQRTPPNSAQELLFVTRPPTSWLSVGPAPARLHLPTFTFSRGSHWPARTCPSVGGGLGGRGERPGEGKRVATEEGDSGEGGRVGGSRAERAAEPRTDRRTDGPPGHAGGLALARVAGLQPQLWSSGCVRWSGWYGTRPVAARVSTASWICCWGCTTSSAAPPCGGSATWRSF